MSEENVEIVRRAIAMFLSGDVEGAIREYADPAMEFVSRFGVMDGRAYSGERELPNYMDDIAETWERYERELEELIEAGDAVVAVLKITAVSKTTGLEVNERVGVAFWLENRRILRMVSFPTVPEALEAAESSESEERPLASGGAEAAVAARAGAQLGLLDRLHRGERRHQQLCDPVAGAISKARSRSVFSSSTRTSPR